MTLRHFAPPDIPRALPHDERPGSYRWWYFDAVADDERSAFAAIFLFGSIFSPYYAARLARGESASPLDHCAVSFVHYRRNERPTFCFSEYGADRVVRGPRGVQIARSSFARDADGAIRLAIDETRVALRTPTHATIELSPREPSLTPGPVHLPARDGLEHAWHAIMPRARVRGRIDGTAFEGTGYHDTNFGSEPPSRLLSSWSWGRVHERDRTRVFFDLETTDGRRIHERFGTGGERGTAILPPRRRRSSIASFFLPIPEVFESEPGCALDRIAPLERSPFYTRFLARMPGTRGERARVGLGEHIDFARLEHPFVRRMIALRLARPDEGEWGTLP